MSNSEYLAHSEPLLKTLRLLKIEEVYKLKLMKFYYNLSYNLLPLYFNYYLEGINNAFPCQYELRQIARPLIRPQRTRPVFTESNVLFQLIPLLNYTHTHYPEILETVKYKTHTYHGFSYVAKEKYLGTYKYALTNWSNLVAVMDWGGANSRFLGLVSVWAARSFDQTALRPSVIKRIRQIDVKYITHITSFGVTA